ncbi:group III truncated hemoglobin [Sphingobacterium sp. CZ-2]|uniref:group III truncated hemoglobin n=1 Tax=Sphingobacterium sp. CZ-2 TaxID=2557994 RepID=UPI00106F132E|nr:group III truncated hemoglobin [Sphingobacterium sp. CZ-2]QBR12893.1 group III truncated hemoglobin [Sphingobacterium sp. CZ-2]
MKPDIQHLDDIKILVDKFYDRIQRDELLGPIFNGIIQDRWPEHLEKMYRFWQTVLLEEHTYYGSPFPPHAKMPINKTHFDHWIGLFSKTVDELYEGEKAEKAKWQGERMASMFQFKIAYYQENNFKPLT